MKKKETVNQQEWKKEEARAKRLIKKYEKQGFVFDVEIPKKPKRITKQALEELKRETRATKILSKGVRVVDQVTGETETARQAVQKKRSAASKAAWERRKWIEIGPGGGDDGGGIEPPGITDVVLGIFYGLCDHWEASQRNRRILKNVSDLRSAVDSYIQTYGKDAVAKAIEDAAINTYFGDIVRYERTTIQAIEQIKMIANEIASNVRKNNGQKTDEK